jgi:hypothetical protein
VQPGRHGNQWPGRPIRPLWSSTSLRITAHTPGSLSPSRECVASVGPDVRIPSARGTLTACQVAEGSAPNAGARSPWSPAASPGTTLRERARKVSWSPARVPAGRRNSKRCSRRWTGTQSPSYPANSLCSDTAAPLRGPDLTGRPHGAGSTAASPRLALASPARPRPFQPYASSPDANCRAPFGPVRVKHRTARHKGVQACMVASAPALKPSPWP